ncbi:MAG: DUF1311 domain-containing protein [Actinobacteria bacterium]|nr:MAG: DUF1311 domain-containing protein [Actinomycetota bacterium]
MNPVDAHLGKRELSPLSAAEALDSFEAGETATTKTKPTTEARSAMRGAIFDVTSADPPNVPSRDIPEHWPRRGCRRRNVCPKIRVMRRAAVFLMVALTVAGCASDNDQRGRATAARPTLPRIHEGFTLLPCARKNPARGSTLGLEGCAEHEILRTDKTIMANERAIFVLLHADGRSAFAKAERSWLAYRAAYCDARASSYKGGSVAPVIFGTCRATINRGHLRALSAFRRELQNR